MRRMHLVLALVGALVAVWCASGCGGDAVSEEKTLTKKQFVRLVEKHCTHGYKAQARAIEAYRKENGLNYRQPSQAEQEEINTAVVLDFVRDKIAYFKSLPAPEGDENKVREMIESMERGLEESELNPASLAQPFDPEPFEDTRHLTAEYGVYVCGQA
jgi:hypothetical protein